MQTREFDEVKQRFQIGDVNKKIEIYTTVEGLTQDQYKELLRMFPRDQISKLEAALQ